MTKKTKAYISIFSMSVLFYMNVSTNHTRALGDYLLEYFDIRSRTGVTTGLHLNVLYFGILFFASLFFVNIYAIRLNGMKNREVLVSFILLILLFNVTTEVTAQFIKKNADGLLSIAYSSEESKIEYTVKDNEVQEFTVSFSLKNYSDQVQKFTVSIDEIDILNSDGTLAVFLLMPGESKHFELDSPEYRIEGESISEVAYSSGSVSDIILTNTKGKSIKLTRNDIFGEVLQN